MTNSRPANSKCLSLKVIFMAVLMVYVLVLFSVAHYLKIDVTTTQGNAVMRDFVNSRETEEQLTAKIREIRNVKSR